MRHTNIGFAAAAILIAALSLPAQAADTVRTYGHSPIGARNLTIAVLLSLALFGTEERTESRRDVAEVLREREPAPEADPTRRINEQDCTKPLELNGGNLRCK